MTITVEIGGKLVEFPDLATAQSYVQQNNPEGPSAWENIWGKGEADTPGERLGQTINDMGKAAFAGLGRGAAYLVGTPGSLIDFVDAGAKKIGLMPDDVPSHPLGGASLARGLSSVTAGASDFRGDTQAGRYTGSVAEFVPGAAMFGVGALPAYAVAPGLLSEAAGQATEGKTIPEWVPGIGGQNAEPWARAGAALAGPTLANAAARVITPNPARPTRIEAANLLKGEGVNVTAGQRTGNATLRTREEYIPRTAQVMADQGDDFTKAVLRRIGVDADRATGPVMNDAVKRIGGMFDDLAGRNNIAADRNLKIATDAALATFDDLSTAPARAPILSNIVDKIDAAIKTGTPIPGEQYQAWRSRLGRVAAKSTDPALREGATGLLNALDDAMERTLRAAGNADELTKYATARQQYRDLLAIERAVSAAGDATSGIVTPGALRAAIVGQGRRAYVTGQRDLGELSKAANEVFPAAHGNSGTQQRAWANMIPGVQSATPAGLLGYALSGGDPMITSAATVAGAMAPVARNAATGSAAGQAWLGNQMFPQQYGILDPRTSAIAATLLGQEEERAKQ